ncbi:MAG TPA: transcriptional regulator [Candidatus Thermoplasmatota archaeon]|nr:transcriptional regulator [Candidatus Thermoplasmatota archaeon]
MTFELTVVSNTPMTAVNDLETVSIAFLYNVGYLPKGYDPKTNVESVKQSVPYKLFLNCFLKRPEKAWSIEELVTVLRTSRPTVYRHLNKLKSYDLLEEVSLKATEDSNTKKGYRIRYGNLAKAWNFSEAHVKVAMEGYRKTVDHLQELANKEIARQTAATAPPENGEAPREEAEPVPMARVRRGA